MKIGNATYDALKNLAQIWLPAAGTLYAGLAVVWGLPYAHQVVESIVAVDTFLGVLLSISTAVYTAGQKPSVGNLTVDKTNPAKDVYTLQLSDSGNPLNGLKIMVPTSTASQPENTESAVPPAS